MGLENNNELKEREEIQLYRGFIYELNDSGVFSMSEDIQKKNILFFSYLLEIFYIDDEDLKQAKKNKFLKGYELVASHDLDKFEENLGNYIDDINKGKNMILLNFNTDESIGRVILFKKNNMIDKLGQTVKDLVGDLTGEKETV